MAGRWSGCVGGLRWLYLHGKEIPTQTRAPRRKGGPIDLVLVRHGESEGNLVKREVKNKNDPSQWVGKLSQKHTANYRLTERGRQQANASGVWIQQNISESFDTYLTSEYIRAQETAGYLSLPEALWEVDPLLRERDKGIFVATVHSPPSSPLSPPSSPSSSSSPNHDNLTEGEGELLNFSSRFREEEPFYWGPPGGESLAGVGERVEGMVGRLFKEEEKKKVVVVCHGNVMRMFRMRLEGLTQAMYLDWEKKRKGKGKGKGKKGKKGVLLGIDNGHIFHYSRRDPVSGEITPTLQFVRFCSPWKEEEGEGEVEGGEWRKIEWPLFGNDVLIRHTESVVQMSERKGKGGGGEEGER